jgi:pyruvate dehydrogenase E1 component alpha subunit
MNMSLPDNKTQLWMYGMMVQSRYYEECIAAAYMEGKQPVFNMANGPIPGEMHLSIGQEPCAVGICAHLQEYDVVTAAHRSHHIALAKGVDINAMTAEIFGKRSGLSGGRGGHMHLFDTRVNFVCSGIVGQGLGPAVGAALARKLRNEAGLAVAFIGEGAANQGAFHEALNLASVWKLPFICVIEDNAYGISVPKATATAVPRNDLRAVAYGIPGEYVEGNDPCLIYAAMQRAATHARAGNGPYLLELETHRLAGHFIGDMEGYRPEGEKERIAALDPIPLMRQRLLEENGVAAQQLSRLESQVRCVVDAAFAFARAAEFPVPEDALTQVFAGEHARD